MFTLGLVTALSLGCNQQSDAPTEKAKTEAKTVSAKDAKKDNAKSKKKAPKKPEKKTIPAPADVAAAPADATKTASGLAYKILKKGNSGKKPQADAKVEVHYTGWQTDGKMFDSSVARGKPISFSLQKVIKGWTEGVQLMEIGDKARFWIPEDLAYQGRKGPPAGMLVFDIELLSFENPPPPPADVAAPPKDAKKTASGLAYKVLKAGTGKEKPASSAKVKVHYTGWTTDGKMFDSSVQRGRPASFGLGRVIKGWTEGLQLMVVGEKARFWIPENLAYQGRKGAPAGMLVFDVELLDIKNPIPAPADVAAPPKDAKKTASGLAYKVLKAGTGKEKPKATERVKVHYTGWTTDGKMFDSSVQRGSPTTFGLNQVIKGWTEGLQLMVVGEKTRFWIPSELAYNNQPGKPAGMLIFDVELLEISAAKARPARPKIIKPKAK